MGSSEDKMTVSVPLGHPTGAAILLRFNEALHGDGLLGADYQIVALVMQGDEIKLKLDRSFEVPLFVTGTNIDQIKDIQDDEIDTLRAKRALAELKRRHANEPDWQ